jgi:predicted Zn-dependent protease with MMP-like domain
MSVEMSREKFARVLEQAIARLPAEFRHAVETDVRVELRDQPTREQLRSVGLEEDELLLGLYEGTPLTERGIDAGTQLPDVIYIFRHDLEDACDSVEELEEEIRITLLHELGHYFGYDEDDLDRLGVG